MLETSQDKYKYMKEKLEEEKDLTNVLCTDHKIEEVNQSESKPIESVEEIRSLSSKEGSSIEVDPNVKKKS